MTTKIGIRDLVRNSNILNKYDFVEVEDKKTRKLKGVFISADLAEEFKKFIEEKKRKKVEAKLKAFNSITPLPSGTLTDKNIQKIKSNKEL